MLRLILPYFLVSLAFVAPVMAADDEEGWTHFTCPPATSVSAIGQVKFEFKLPPEWSPVLPPVQGEKWMATELVSSSLALLEGTLHLTCTYATGGEMLAKVERLIPNAEAKFSECVRDNAKRCAIKGRRKHQDAENACLVDVKSHPPRPETQLFLPFGVMSCQHPTSDESGCHFKCRN
jgi:hypothetical protein